jgi:hypothetical protein
MGILPVLFMQDFLHTGAFCYFPNILLCATHGIKGSNLANALHKMKEQGLIEGSLFEWANELRLVGNEAVHDITAQVSGEDARDLLEFTEAIVEYLIMFRDRFDRYHLDRQ